jgi:vitamin B12 transporter
MSKKIATLIALGAALNAIAQKDTLSGKPLDEVTVSTANKVEQKQSTTGKVVTVISKETIEKSAGKSVAQVLNEQAGITINGAYNATGTVQTVFMRGSNAGRTLILLDGIPMNDPSTITTDFDLNMFSINEVERIEVCRGAQSTLYGSDAIAGVINIITLKKDITKPFNVKATATGGNLGTFKGNLQLYGKANKLTYTARYSRLQTTGFSSAYDSTGTKDFDKDGYKGDVVNAAIQYQATKNLMVKTFALYSQYKADIDASIFTDEKDYSINNKQFTTGFGVNYKTDIVNIVGNYQYTDLKRNYINDSGFVGGFSKYEKNEYYGRTQFGEVYASIKLGSGFTLLQGGDFRYGLMSNDYLSISSFGPYTSNFKDSAMSQTSMYSSLIFNSANKKINIEFGGRLNTHSKYGSNYTYTFNPSYTIDSHYRIFGSVASGFKTPSLYQLYAGGGTGNPNLLPEKSINYEIGVQQTHNKITNRLVFFYRDINDGIDYSNVTFKYFNFIKQTVRGLEYEISVQTTKNLSITANYTYLSSNEQTQSRINFKDTGYTYLLRRPAHNINVNIGYQFTPTLYASISSKSVSKRNDVGGYKKADIELDGYFLLGAYAEYKLKNYFKFFVDAQNITNKKFFDIRGYNAIPTMVNGGVTFNW